MPPNELFYKRALAFAPGQFDSVGQIAGALLEGISRLFTQNVRLIVYPMPSEEVRTRLQASGLTNSKWNATDSMVSADNLHPSGPFASLYQYLLSSEFILPGKPEEH